MRYRKIAPYALAGTAAAVGLALAVPGLNLIAADHLDPPARTDPAVDSTPDRAADIADIYAWHTDSSLILALTFAGPNAPNEPATYDRDVLYSINISNAGAATDTEIPIRIRFGKGSGDNQWGVQVAGIPDTPTITGRVETNLIQDGVKVRAGLFDDPFFFDLQGFKDTKATGTLMIRNNRDFFAGKNDTAVVIEIPRSKIANGNNPLNIWAATSRIGGQL